MEIIDELALTFDHTSKVVGGVTPDQLGAATPCAEWDVKALLAHTTGVVANIGNGVRGEELFDVSGFELAADPDGQFRDAAAATLAAWRGVAPDAQVNIGAGPMPAAAAIQINLLDTATHSWDIARATGQDGELPDELAEQVLAACQMIVTDDVRGYAGFAAAVEPPAGASATLRLVSFLGRKV